MRRPVQSGVPALRLLPLLGLVGALVGCATGRAVEPAPQSAPPPPAAADPTLDPDREPDNDTVQEAAMTETIDETTVGDLDGVRVPMGNMTTGTYTLPDGTEETGTICSLALPGGPGVFVGLGSRVDVEGTTWEVVGIEKSPGELGSVTLQKRAD